ncbi:MAG: deoxyguanosinetriphosphate triphosphohydrolase, partial [Acidobacteriota bacterium]
EAVRAHDGRLVGHSEEVVAEIETIASFLMVRLYRSPRVEQEMANARRVIAGLVAAYQEDPGRLPLRHQARFEHETPTVVIADYVAGMTDRYALRAWRRLQEGR